MTWLLYAFISAAAAALTAILAKIGVEGIPSTLATAFRTVVVAAFAWLIVFGAGEHRAIGSVTRRSWLFLSLSGLATAISWLAYFPPPQPRQAPRGGPPPPRRASPRSAAGSRSAGRSRPA